MAGERFVKIFTLNKLYLCFLFLFYVVLRCLQVDSWHMYIGKKGGGRVGGGEAQPWKMGISRWKCFTPVTKLFQLPVFLKTDL